MTMSNGFGDCFECGNKATFADLNYPFYAYCLPCIREMYPAKGEGNE